MQLLIKSVIIFILSVGLTFAETPDTPPKKKKSKYKHIVINKKKYYFHKISWFDITGDSGHATKEEFDKFEPAYMVSHAYVYKRTGKYLYTFSSYDEKEEVFSDRNIFPIGCIVKLEKILM